MKKKKFNLLKNNKILQTMKNNSLKKKEIEQKKNKIIVDPLNPLASLAKIDNSQIKEETTKS